MTNRIMGLLENKGTNEVSTFFLACEFKPNNPLFSVLDPFAYDIQPAFIYGSLGVIAYEPPSYAIIDTDGGDQPLLGYILTITEPNTITLLDKLKGYLGEEAFNAHEKTLVQAFTDIEKSRPAWIYKLNEAVLENYEQIEQVELGLHSDDEILLDFLERIGENL